MFGRFAILSALGLSPHSSNVLDSGYAGFERVFKNVWADNADVISKLYSGTGALKTDFTRLVVPAAVTAQRRSFCFDLDLCRRECGRSLDFLMLWR